MNGQELSAKMNGLSTADLRKLWTAAIKELGMTTKMVIAYEVEIDEALRCGDYRAAVHSLIWKVRCDKRVFTNTGKKEWVTTDRTFGTGHYENVQSCSWAESDAATARIFAVVGR